MELLKIENNKKEYMNLLLLADPAVEAIERYLYDGELYIFKDGADTAAVLESLQGKGIGSEFLKRLINEASKSFTHMLVGTTSPTEGFYKSLGFEYSHTIPNFFIDNYPEPVYEDGIQCVDMRCFEIMLRKFSSI